MKLYSGGTKVVEERIQGVRSDLEYHRTNLALGKDVDTDAVFDLVDTLVRLTRELRACDRVTLEEVEADRNEYIKELTKQEQLNGDLTKANDELTTENNNLYDELDALKRQLPPTPAVDWAGRPITTPAPAPTPKPKRKPKTP